jgi:hypothetical protein
MLAARVPLLLGRGNNPPVHYQGGGGIVKDGIDAQDEQESSLGVKEARC